MRGKTVRNASFDVLGMSGAVGCGWALGLARLGCFLLEDACAVLAEGFEGHVEALWPLTRQREQGMEYSTRWVCLS